MNDYTSSFDQKDIEANKGMSILSYLGFLWIIPLLVSRKKSPYTRFHLNQGLTLIIAEFIISVLRYVVNIVLNFIGLRLFAGIFGGVFTILSVICLVLMIIGIMNVIAGTAKELPVIGKVRIIR
jgi:uncharacterized membrane protein